MLTCYCTVNVPDDMFYLERLKSTVDGACEHFLDAGFLCNSTHSLSAVRNRLWVVAPSMLTGHAQEPMRQQQ